MAMSIMVKNQLLCKHVKVEQNLFYFSTVLEIFKEENLNVRMIKLRYKYINCETIILK